MAYRSLREFLKKLEAEGELVRVSTPVSTVLEMTEIQTRLLATGGPAVLFEKPVRADGEVSPIPALANLFGTVKRVAMGVTLQGKERTTARDLREVGELLAFYALIGQLYNPIVRLTQFQATTASMRVSVERLFEVLGEPEPIRDRPDAQPVGRPQGALELRGVRF